MKWFARDKDGKVFEVDSNDQLINPGTRMICSDLAQAEQMFKQLESAFPGGKGLLEMLIDEPFED